MEFRVTRTGAALRGKTSDHSPGIDLSLSYTEAALAVFDRALWWLVSAEAPK